MGIKSNVQSPHADTSACGDWTLTELGLTLWADSHRVPFHGVDTAGVNTLQPQSVRTTHRKHLYSNRMQRKAESYSWWKLNPRLYRGLVLLAIVSLCYAGGLALALAAGFYYGGLSPSATIHRQGQSLLCGVCRRTLRHSGGLVAYAWGSETTMVSAPPYTNRETRRVYQLGFSKTGTTSLWAWFGQQGSKSRHYNYGELYDVVAAGQVLHERFPQTRVFTNIVSNTGAELTPRLVLRLWATDPNATFLYTHVPARVWRQHLLSHPELLLPTLARGRCRDKPTCIADRLAEYAAFHHFMRSAAAPPHLELDVTDPESQRRVEAAFPEGRARLETHHQAPFWETVSAPCVEACQLN